MAQLTLWKQLRGESTNTELTHELRDILGISTITQVARGVRYDLRGDTDQQLAEVGQKVLHEAPIDEILTGQAFAALHADAWILVTSPLVGQYDQRADFASQAAGLLGAQVQVASADVFVIRGALSDADRAHVLQRLVNPVDTRVVAADEFLLAEAVLQAPVDPDLETVDGFSTLSESALQALKKAHGLAFSDTDMAQVQTHFAGLGRDPRISELKILDMYWSDHCRHTTFLTELRDVRIGGQVALADGQLQAITMTNERDAAVHEALAVYMQERADLGRTKPVSLMDIATHAARVARAQGLLDDQEQSDEINAASIRIDVDFADGRTEPWLFQFKNETHNHPTEISPFGGASTALGGCIRDPMSGRSYVFMGVRYVGTADPTQPLSDTLTGKLPQRTLNQQATEGFAAYGNQIGVPTQLNKMAVHAGYVAKRLCCGCVGAATPEADVRREAPVVGDIIVMLGGATGRDGIGGATGSSKVQDEQSVATAGAEVQKGNPPTERALMRLFDTPACKHLIKKCNDGGAGGIANAVGEMAEGVEIQLQDVPTKYAGLTPTELALSESQERMFVCIAASDWSSLKQLADHENVPATNIAQVIAEPVLRMKKDDVTVAEIPRDIMEGWPNHVQSAEITSATPLVAPAQTSWSQHLSHVAHASLQPVQQRFDHCVGGNTLLSPFDGATHAGPQNAAVASIPAEGAKTAMAITTGFDAALSMADPFLGGAYAVVESVAQQVATGADLQQIRITIQNYFERMEHEPARWGKPLASQLGALVAQRELRAPAIGGKDSMSGTFVDSGTGQRIDVPPTLISFAVGRLDGNTPMSSVLATADADLWLLPIEKQTSGLPNWDALRAQYAQVARLNAHKQLLAARAVGTSGLAGSVSGMLFGADLGADLTQRTDWVGHHIGALVVAVTPGTSITHGEKLGTINASGQIHIGDENHTTQALRTAWQAPLQDVFGAIVQGEKTKPLTAHDQPPTPYIGTNMAQPRVAMPLFLGTNCERETERAFVAAGAQCTVLPFQNQTPEQTQQTLVRLAQTIRESQILMLSGGFSAGDQPDGSAKFMALCLRTSVVAEALHDLLARDGLILGICNGFQGLMKSGWLPFGEPAPQTETSQTLAWNTCGHFIAQDTGHRVTSIKSPWMAHFTPGEEILIPVAHGEGRFVATDAQVAELHKNAQIAWQYTHNINGSAQSVAGITDASGRILGMMAHPERAIGDVRQSSPAANMGQKLFQAGVDHFQS